MKISPKNWPDLTNFCQELMACMPLLLKSAMQILQSDSKDAHADMSSWANSSLVVENALPQVIFLIHYENL